MVVNFMALFVSCEDVFLQYKIKDLIAVCYLITSMLTRPSMRTLVSFNYGYYFCTVAYELYKIMYHSEFCIRPLS